MTLALRPDAKAGFIQVVGIGGIGTGVAFQLEGEHTLGREESRPGALLPGRDYCKLHIVEHNLATLMGANAAGRAFRVAAIGVVGEDAAGRHLLNEMNEAGVDTQWVRLHPERGTLFSACFVYPDGTGGNITANNSAAATIEEKDLQLAAASMKEAGARGSALCLPEVPLDIRQIFLKLATECQNFRAASFTLAEIAPALALGLFSSIDLLALNREEASAIVGYRCTAANTERFLEDCSAVLTAMQPEMQILISAGGDGAYGFRNGMWSSCAAPRVEVASTAGGGDALLGGVLAGLAAGLPLTGEEASAGRGIHSALELGVLLASYSVTSPDAIHFGASLSALKTFAADQQISLGIELHRAIREY